MTFVSSSRRALADLPHYGRGPNSQTWSLGSFKEAMSPGTNRKVTSCWSGWRYVLFGSWLNLLLVLVLLVPVISYAIPNSNGVVFILCILALIPLVKMHDLGTRDLSLRIGNNRTGLVNASLGNIVETVIAIIALRRCELRVVQTTLIGSMLGRLLLVLGLCFFAGGLRFREQDFNATATQVQTSLLTMSTGAILLPAVYHYALGGRLDDNAQASESQRKAILDMSHGVSVVLLLVYIAFLLFQLWSHTYLYKDRDPNARSQPHDLQVPSVRLPVLESFQYQSLKGGKRSLYGVKSGTESTFSLTTSDIRPPCKPYNPLTRESSNDSDTTLAMSRTVTGSSSTEARQSTALGYAPRRTNSDLIDMSHLTFGSLKINRESEPTVRLVRDPMFNDSTLNLGGSRHADFDLGANSFSQDRGVVEEDAARIQPSGSESSVGSSASTNDHTQPKLGWALNLLMLVVVTVVVALVADQLVETMDEIPLHIDKTWIGLILVPSVGAIAECITAVNVSVKDQLRLSISVAVGATIQTALFVIPLMVLVGWSMGIPLSLLFDPFESIVLYIAVQTTSYVVGDGKSNWLEGFILISFYIIIAISFWFYPDYGANLTSSLGTCKALP